MFIFSNLATTLDGKIAAEDRAFYSIGTAEDHRQMQVLRQRCDAILGGAGTLRGYRKPQLVFGKEQQPANVIVSSHLEGISTDWEFFTHPNLQRIFFVGHKTPVSRIKAISQYSKVFVLKRPSQKEPIALQILKELKTLRFKSLLVEGGGKVMWDFVSQNLIDEFHVTITPQILGGRKNPSLVDGEGFRIEQMLKLKLVQCRVVQDELFLVYRRPTT